jgi:hypothetical protein
VLVRWPYEGFTEIAVGVAWTTSRIATLTGLPCHASGPLLVQMRQGRFWILCWRRLFTA